MKSFTIIVFLVLHIQLLAQDHFVFSTINANNGLSDNSVRNICQLNDGRMVIVTWGMINIYDGTNFMHLPYNDREAYSLTNFYGWHRLYIDNNDNIWLKNQHKLYLFDVNKETFVPNIDSIFNLYGIKNRVTDFFIDSEDNTWFITDKNELFLKRSDAVKSNVFIPNVAITNFHDDQLIDIETVEDEIFLFYKSGEMVCYDSTTRKEKFRDNPFGNGTNLNTSTIRIVPYNGYLYQVRNYDGYGITLRYDIKNQVWDTILKTDCWQNTLTIDKKGNIWISTFKGLWLIDINLSSKQLISPIPLTDGRFIETEITTQYNDDSGGLWVGSINRGLFYYHPDRFKFKNFGRTFFKMNDNEKLRVTGFSETNNDILVGTYKGLYKYDKRTGVLNPFNRIPENTICNMLYKDSKNGVWLCTDNNGLYHITNTGIKHFSKPLSSQYILEALDNRLYVGTENGFGIFDPLTGSFEKIKSSLDKNLGYVFQLEQYGKNKLLGISSVGLFIYDCINKTISFPDRDEAIFKHNNHIYHSIYADSRGKMWFGTQNGLYVYNPNIDSTQSFFRKDGLVNNAIRSIIEDNYGRIWVSTSNGISCIEISGDKMDYRYSITNYNRYDGVIENEFYYRSVFISSDNYILWGGIDGFNEIKLTSIDSSRLWLSKPLITKFKIFGSEIKIGEKYEDNIILNQSISSTRRIELRHFQNFLSFDFSALNFLNPEQTFYRYRLEGFDASWIETGSVTGIGSATYTNLSPGTYRLVVYAANNSKQWGNDYAEVTIVIHPPFWKTNTAYTIYTILFLIIFYLVLSYLFKLQKRKIQKQQNEALDQMKLSFFTNVSHELRTPLTLIITPLASILKRINNEQLYTQLTGVYRNAQDLLRIVNQLLDYRKLELKGETLQLTYCNVSELFETICSPFKELANELGISFNLESNEKNIHAFIDKDKLGKIVNNLLSNAFKFTPGGGKITFRVFKVINNFSHSPMIKLQVIDTGCGIPENELSKIFNRFYQSNNRNSHPGSGIGLYLVKEYVQLCNGSVSVESQINKGSTFTVILPIKMLISEEFQVSDKSKDTFKRAKLLIVDDSIEFRSFLFHELSGKYDVLLASDGEQALEIAREHHPDLVITDLMMPGMSGTEFCRILKNEIQISHIPVVLITALTSDEDHINAFRSRADAYITKPFNLEILLLQIQNLIEQRTQRKILFKDSATANPEEFGLTKVDEEFIKRTIRHIENNLNNSSYSVDQLSKDMCMDRTGLYRKLLALVEQTPTEYIRSIRLKKAAQLLEDGLSVNEVSENVGFGTTSYFIKCFQKEFGIKPFRYKHLKLGRNTNIQI